MKLLKNRSNFSILFYIAQKYPKILRITKSFWLFA